MLTAKLLKQGYRYHKLSKAFSKFYRRHYDPVSKFNVGLKSLLKQGLSEAEFYSDLMYKFRKIVGGKDFPNQFRNIIIRNERTGYNINVIRQTACLVVNPLTVTNYAVLFSCTPAGQASDLMKIYGREVVIKVDWGSMLCLWSGPPWFNGLISVAPAFQGLAEQIYHLVSSQRKILIWFACVSRNPSRWPNNVYVWEPQQNLERRLHVRKAGLSSPVTYYLPVQGGASVIVYSNCLFPSAFCWALTFCYFI